VVVNNGKGSGLLPHPTGRRLLDVALPSLSRLSIKLGSASAGRRDPRAPADLRRYPLNEQIVHPRTAVQM
jgi:hypothetical protein